MWLKDIDQSWSLFLDRDGVINQRNFEGYITNINDFIFTPNFLNSIPILSNIFGSIIIVTNQQGIGKGLMSENDLHKIHNYMLDAIKKVGGRVDDIFFAHNLKNAKNDRRKPLPVMGLEAQNKNPKINFSKSIMIGDTNSDMFFGKNLGMKTILLKSTEQVTTTVDLEIENFIELLKIFGR
jgi:D-glycero-D-manno-heptose 1,7-bisphosphate phosphatase